MESGIIDIDKSGSNSSAIWVYNKRALGTKSRIKVRKCKYLNNIVEQDHRFIKWRIQQGLGFKDFVSAKRTLAGIEISRITKENQLISQDESAIKSFTSLAANSYNKTVLLECVPIDATEPLKIQIINYYEVGFYPNLSFMKNNRDATEPLNYIKLN